MSIQSQRLDLVPKKIGGLAALARVAEENGKASVNDLTFRDMGDDTLKAYLTDFEEFAGEEARIKLAYMMEEVSAKHQSIAKLAFKRKAYTLVKAEIEKRGKETQADKLEEQEVEDEESGDTEGSSDEDSEEDESGEVSHDEDTLKGESSPEKDSDDKEDEKEERNEEKKPWEVPLTARQVASAELAKKIRHFASNEDAQNSIPTDIELRKAIWDQLETNPLLVSWSKTSAKKGRVFESTTDLKYRFSIKETTLVTNFGLRIESEQDVKDLKKLMASEKAQTYLTQPPLPINLHLLLASDYPVNNVTIQCEVKPCVASKLIGFAVQLTGIAVKQFPSSKKTMKWSDSLMKMENDEDVEVLGQFVEVFNRLPSFTRDAVFAAPVAATKASSAAEAAVASAGEQDEKVEESKADVSTATNSPEETEQKAVEAPVGKKSKKNKRGKKCQVSTITTSTAVETPTEKETEPLAGSKAKKSKKSKKAKAAIQTTVDAVEEPREEEHEEEREASASLDVAHRCVVN